MDVDEAADRLYALPPGDFVEARDALVRQARASGDREQARHIADLRKPTAVAWLANRLARERPDQLADFLALGAPLREASASLSGPALRELSRQRQQLVQALVREARQVAGGGAGPRVGEDVMRGLETTLHAALADPGAAALVATGRLSGALSHTGFGAGPATGSASEGPEPAAPDQPSRPSSPRAAKKATAADRRAAARAQLESELAQARTLAREAAEDREIAEEAAAQAATAYDDAEARVVALQDELRGVHERLAAAERDRDAARADRTRTTAARGKATRLADRAREAAAQRETRIASLPTDH